MKRRITSVLLIVCIVTTMLNVQQIRSYASGSEKGRLINVVYDDSGSMVKDGNDYTRWG